MQGPAEGQDGGASHHASGAHFQPQGSAGADSRGEHMSRHVDGLGVRMTNPEHAQGRSECDAGIVLPDCPVRLCVVRV